MAALPRATALAGSVAVKAVDVATSTVFCYGTLMSEEVVNALLGRRPVSCPALLRDYHRHSIKRRTYPAVVPCPGDTVNGKLLFGLSPVELELFDGFEDEEYGRVVVTVTPDTSNSEGSGAELSASETVQAFLYVWKDVNDPDLEGTWEYEAWRSQWLSEYVRMCRQFADDWRRHHGLPPLQDGDDAEDAAAATSAAHGGDGDEGGAMSDGRGGTGMRSGNENGERGEGITGMPSRGVRMVDAE